MPIVKQIETYSSGDAINLSNRYPVAIICGANSGALTAGVSDGSTYRALRTIAGTADFSITATANTCIPLDPAIFKGLTSVKFTFATPSGVFQLITNSN